MANDGSNVSFMAFSRLPQKKAADLGNPRQPGSLQPMFLVVKSEHERVFVMLLKQGFFNSG